jgi:hypothetical protein
MVRLVGLLLLACILASAGPISGCISGAGSSFTCNFYETLADGTPSEVSNIVILPNMVTTGYVVLFETPAGSFSDSSTWSDVLAFLGSGATNQAQLWSSGGFTPSFITAVQSSSSIATLVETQTGTGNDFLDFTTFTAGPDVYNIYSAAPNVENAPEPASLAFGAVGMVCLGVTARRRKRK